MISSVTAKGRTHSRLSRKSAARTGRVVRNAAWSQRAQLSKKTNQDKICIDYKLANAMYQKKQFNKALVS